MSNHTPGPWMTFKEPNGTISINTRDDDGTCGPQIGSVIAENTDREDIVEADARLIAAAPAMLETLNEILANCGCTDDSTGLCSNCERALEAIANATGKAL